MMRTRTAEVPRMAGASPLLFQSLVVTGLSHQSHRRRAPFVVSAGVHSALLATVVALPLLLSHALPGAREATTFFAPPLELTMLPPPPPVLGGGSVTLRPVRRAFPPTRNLAWFAPGLTQEIETDDSDLLGAGPGDPNGVPGGVPGGVVGSILTDPAPQPPPVPPTRVVRISQLQAPRLLRKVAPVYPELAIAIHLSTSVTLEAEVDARGRVKGVSILRGHPLFDEAAIAAVRQWIYTPLLLNGEPTGFILTVTIDFNLR